MDFAMDVAERNCMFENQGTVCFTPRVNNIPGQSSRHMDLQDSRYTYEDYHQRAYNAEELGTAIGNDGIQITEIVQHLLGESEVVGTDEAALLARVRSLNSFLELDRGNHTNNTNRNNIIASQIISENAYRGYCSGSSLEVHPCDDVNMPRFNPSTNSSFSADLLPALHECESLSPLSQCMCHWS